MPPINKIASGDNFKRFPNPSGNSHNFLKDKITSFQNPQIKRIAELRESKTRKATGLTLVEGIREVTLAWKAGVEFKEFFICPEFLEKPFPLPSVPSKGEGTKIYEVTPEIFSKIAFGERQEGILGIGAPKVLRWEDLRLPPRSLCVLVEGIEKPGNLGAILRTADAAGVDALLVGGGGTDIYNPNVIRASLGTVFTVKMIPTTNEAALEFFRSRKIKIYAAIPGAKTVYTHADFKIPSVLVLGSEDEGLSDFWKKAADSKIKIPMAGSADSLNVSASAAVILFEALRQRSG